MMMTIFNIFIPGGISSDISYVMALPDRGLQNGIKLSNFIKYCSCSAYFSKGKKLPIPWNVCIFQYTNSTCIHNNIACPHYDMKCVS